MKTEIFVNVSHYIYIVTDYYTMTHPLYCVVGCLNKVNQYYNKINSF